jgi:chitinase
MTYDAGRNFDYKTSMNNYFKAVGGRSDLRFGVSINQQWGQHGRFVMPVNENNARAKWQAEQKYGGFFVWAIGASSEARSLDSQIRIFNLLVDAANDGTSQ